MFRGRYPANIDAKSRLVLPARYREVLQVKEENVLLLTCHEDHCLSAYPLTDWERSEENIKQPGAYDDGQSDYIMYFFSLVSECPLDGQGRILIPSLLREHAQLEKEAILIGMGIKIAIWARELWNQFETTMARKKPALRKQMNGFGF